MKLLFSLLLMTAASIAQGQKIINDVNAEARKVSPFTGIAVSGGIDMILTSGDEALAVSASSPEFRNRIKTQVENGILKIGYDSKWGISINGNKDLKVYVSYKILKSLEASGGSDVVVDGKIAGDDLVLRVSGGSDFKGSVDVTSLTVRQSGGSDVKISGKTSSLIVDASGGSDFKGYDLAAERCDLEASGACDIEITANTELSARASGASEIHYKGKAIVKEMKASGASSVKAKS